MNKILVDLHTHSTYSDGLYTPRQLVEEATANGIQVLSITDHDSFGGIVEAQQAADEIANAPKIITGVELGTQQDGASVHILGYHVNINYEPLLLKMKEMRYAREIRLQKMLSKLAELGFYIEVEECDPLNRAVGRPHVAKALVEKGYFSDIQSTFDTLLKRGKPAYIPQPKLSPEEAIGLLHAAGAIAILAHPSELNSNIFAEELIQKLNFDGIEVYHPSASLEEQNHWLKLAREYDLLIGGGSDFHAVAGRYPSKLGVFEVLYSNTKSVIEYKQ